MSPSSSEPAKPGRAGRYVSQVAGYKAFIPASLPPSPPIQFSSELQVKLSEAAIALGRLDGSIKTLPNPDLFVLMYIRKEAVLSSQIEGTESSLQDVLEAEAKALRPNRPSDTEEVINYVRAMRHGLNRLAKLPVSVRLIREIHKELLEGVRGSHLAPGELRTSQNWIGPAGCTLGEAIFVPPPPQEVPAQLAQLEKFLHSEIDMAPLIKFGIAHAQFETIHPFLDGNGRVGRLLITLLLCERQILVKPVLYLSYYFKKNRQRYYDELQSVRDAGTWERWLSFFLQGVNEVSEQAAETAGQILALREEHRRKITDTFGRAAGNGHRVLEYLYENPIVSTKNIQDCLDATYPVANNVAKRMLQSGILTQRPGRSRNRIFIYRDYVRLFHEDGEAE